MTVSPERLVTGSGRPVTIFAHGLGESIPATRPFGSGVPGTKVFLQFRGHGRTPAPPGPWTYDDLVAELLAVADPAEARQAVGVSLGAAVLLRLLEQRPERFDRVALLIPAMFDRARPDRVVRREISPAYARLLREPPVEDPGALAAVTAPTLVVGQEGDDEHPREVAERVAAALPTARLEILPPGGLLVAHRARLRALLSDFLAGDGAPAQDQ